MEYMYCALLLHKAGQEINEANMEKTLTAAGVTADAGRIKATVTALKDVDINNVLAETIIASSAPVVAASEQASPDLAEQSSAEPSAKAEGEEKKNEESAAAGLGALFG